jgi:menaquinone-9 beta-reductase
VLRWWGRERERDCLEVYQWTNLLARGEPMSPLEVELYREAQDDPLLARRMADVFSRSARPAEVLTLRRSARLAARALRRRGSDRVATLAASGRDVSTAVADWRERLSAGRA